MNTNSFNNHTPFNPKFGKLQKFEEGQKILNLCDGGCRMGLKLGNCHLLNFLLGG